VFQDIRKLLTCSVNRTFTALTEDRNELLQNAYQTVLERTEEPREKLNELLQGALEFLRRPPEK